jgi:hypothetical protein
MFDVFERPAFEAEFDIELLPVVEVFDIELLPVVVLLVDDMFVVEALFADIELFMFVLVLLTLTFVLSLPPHAAPSAPIARTAESAITFFMFIRLLSSSQSFALPGGFQPLERPLPRTLSFSWQTLRYESRNRLSTLKNQISTRRNPVKKAG